MKKELEELFVRGQELFTDINLHPEVYLNKFYASQDLYNFKKLVNDDGYENLQALIEYFGDGVELVAIRLFSKIFNALDIKSAELPRINSDLPVQYIINAFEKNEEEKEELKSNFLKLEKLDNIDDVVDILSVVNYSILGQSLLFYSFAKKENELINACTNSESQDGYKVMSQRSIANIMLRLLNLDKKINPECEYGYLRSVVDNITAKRVSVDKIKKLNKRNTIVFTSDNKKYYVLSKDIPEGTREFLNTIIEEGFDDRTIIKSIIKVNKDIVPACVNGVIDPYTFYDIKQSDNIVCTLYYDYLTNSDKSEVFQNFYNMRIAKKVSVIPSILNSMILTFTSDYYELDDQSLDINGLENMKEDYSNWYTEKKLNDKIALESKLRKEKKINEVVDRVTKMYDKISNDISILEYYLSKKLTKEDMNNDRQYIMNHLDDDRLNKCFHMWEEIVDRYNRRARVILIEKYVPVISVLRDEKVSYYQLLQRYPKFDADEFSKFISDYKDINLAERKICKAFANRVLKYPISTKDKLLNASYTFNTHQMSEQDKKDAMKIIIDNGFPMCETLYKQILKDNLHKKIMKNKRK